jgi:hypothetical protein
MVTIDHIAQENPDGGTNPACQGPKQNAESRWHKYLRPKPDAKDGW